MRAKTCKAGWITLTILVTLLSGYIYQNLLFEDRLIIPEGIIIEGKVQRHSLGTFIHVDSIEVLTSRVFSSISNEELMGEAKGDGHVSSLMMINGDTIIVMMPLNKMLEKLRESDRYFCRVHKQYAVNTTQIRSMCSRNTALGRLHKQFELQKMKISNRYFQMKSGRLTPTGGMCECCGRSKVR